MHPVVEFVSCILWAEMLLQTYQNALIFASFPERYNIANNELRHSHQASTSNTRERTKNDELNDILCKR